MALADGINSLILVTDKYQQTGINLGDGMVTSKVPDDRFLAALQELIYPKIGLLPPVIRWISASKRIVLLERPPMMKRVAFHAAKAAMVDIDKPREHVFELPIPWTLYAIELGPTYWPTVVSVFALQHSIRSVEDPLGLLPLPNLYESGAICPPPFNPESITSIAEGVNAGYRMVWDSGFNTDLAQAIRQAGRSRMPVGIFASMTGRFSPLKVYKQWERADLEDVVNWVWPTPIGYGAGLTKTHGAHTATYGRLVQMLAKIDASRIGGSHGEGLVLMIKQALSSA